MSSSMAKIFKGLSVQDTKTSDWLDSPKASRPVIVYNDVFPSPLNKARKSSENGDSHLPYAQDTQYSS